MPRAPKAAGHFDRTARPAWQGSNRRAELPSDWAEIRARVLARDEHRCTEILIDLRCPLRATDVDHLGKPWDHRDEMLTSKCARHHLQKTGAEGARSKRRR